ncbi:MAG: peptide deformylase [Candidatus Aureabacteria bacterium]|nr:peptide deformylase [Candidatus Auribacterota bacterium]
MKIFKYGSEVLRKKAEKVVWSEDIRKLIADMFRTMREGNGVGLAAPQVGRSARVIVIDIGDGGVALVNPEIVKKKGKETCVEGCLSFPGIEFEIERAGEVDVKGLNDEGREVHITACGLFARALQHEIDHLDGVLIVDRTSFLSRKLASSKLKKLIKESKKNEMLS